MDLLRRGPSGTRCAEPSSVHSEYDFPLGPGLCHRMRFADLREWQSLRDGYDETSVRRCARERRKPAGIGVNHVRANDEAHFLGSCGLARDAADHSAWFDLVEQPLERRPWGHGVRDRVELWNPCDLGVVIECDGVDDV